MSVGLMCDCPEGSHLARRRTACGMYSADQVTGGPCQSCAKGFHAPCDRRVTPDVSTAAPCPNCLFSQYLHDGFTVVRA